MPTNVIMPALGMDQDKGTLVRWIKQEGDSVAKGEPIMEVETDKVLVEIEATASGVLANVSAAEGDEIPVGQVIAEIVEEGTTPAHPAVSKELRPDSAAATPSTASVQDVGATRVARQTDPPQSSRTLASPKARRLASEQGVDPAAIRGSGPEGAVLAGDLVPADR